MATNDIIDLDPYLEDIEESQLFKYPEAIIDRPYSGERPLDPLKNFLVEDLGVPQNILDMAVGRPGGFRDRAFTLDPTSPTKVGMFGPGIRGVKELFQPTDVGTLQAKEAGIKDDPAFQISRTAAFLPSDSYDTGVQKLVRQYYAENFDTPANFNYEFQREPFNNQVIYRDPTDNELKFINPPGIDLANVTAGLEPLIAEFSGLGAGALAGSVAGQPVAGGITGEILASYVWRLNNLNNLADQGLLDESYDAQKINMTAMRDAGFTALFSLGGAGTFKAVTAFLGNTKAIPGVPEEEFTSAFKALEAEADTVAKQNVLETATVPEIMEAGSVGSPTIRRGLEAELIDAASKGDKKAAEVAARLETGRQAKKEAIEETIEEAGDVIPTKQGTVKEELTILEPEQVLRKEELGIAMRTEFDDTIDPKILEAENAIEAVRGDFDIRLGSLVDETVEPEVALESLRNIVKDIAKGKKALPGTGKGFKIKLNKLLFENKDEGKILDNVLDLAKTSDRKFFKDFLNDPNYIESNLLLQKAFRNKYKNMLSVDDSGNFVPMSREAHTRFLRENKNLMDDLLTPEEVSKFTDATAYAGQLSRQEAKLNKIISDLGREPWGKNTDPEFIFRETWTKQKEGITKTRQVKDIIIENQELSDEYRLLILNDMRKQTDNFKGDKIVDYIDDYGAMLEEWYPKQVVKNLREYSQLIKDLKVDPGAKGGDDLSIEVLNKMARVYVGFFTAPGRALSAAKQLLGVYKNTRFIETLLDPKKYLSDIQKRKQFFQNPYVKAFARGAGRTYGRETDVITGFDEPTTGQIETTDPILIGEDLELNMGGSPLIELKYN